MSFVFRSAPVRTAHTARAARVSRHISGQRYASSTTRNEANSLSDSIKTIVYTTTAVVGTTLFAIYYADSRSAIHRYVVPPLSRVLLDSESAHKLALGALRSGLGPRDQGKDDERLKVELLGEVLSNPVGLAAGFDKDGEAVDGLFNLGFGWVEIGSVTPRPQPGNEKPRVFHLADDKAVINRYGFPSKGSTSVQTRLQARHQAYSNSSSSEPPHSSLRDGKFLSINLGKNKSSAPDSISDFLNGVRMFGPLADVLVINVSSPNTPGLRNLQSRGMLIELLSAVKKERDSLKLDRKLPSLLVKVAPDLSAEELSDVADAIREAGIDGVIVSNTTIQRPASLKSKNKGQTGGLSGDPLKPLTLKALKTLRPLLPETVPIIGCGGISSGADAIDFAKAGASAVQVYTSFAYSGAGTPRRIKDEITHSLRKSNQTWMDVVKEGLNTAWRDTPSPSSAPIPALTPVPISTSGEEAKKAVEDGAKTMAALTRQIEDILKAEVSQEKELVKTPDQDHAQVHPEPPKSQTQ